MKKIKILLCEVNPKPKWTCGHLIYIIDDCVVLDPTKKGVYNYPFDLNVIEKFYKIIDCIEIKENKLKRENIYLSINLYSCISFGQMLLGINGMFFNPKSFFKKLKTLKN
jgi:hypothetical protein